MAKRLVVSQYLAIFLSVQNHDVAVISKIHFRLAIDLFDSWNG